jgi:tRNA G18 (ribose-2'-O)-methylase SpoU
MPEPVQKAEQYFQDALRDIGAILRSTHADATAGEKITRIAWVIGNLPEGLRETVIAEAQNRVTIGWAAGKKPTDW